MMENELLQSIGRLYVEASRLQAMVQQLQERVSQQDVQLKQLAVPPQTVTAIKLPPEMIRSADE